MLISHAKIQMLNNPAIVKGNEGNPLSGPSVQSGFVTDSSHHQDLNNKEVNEESNQTEFSMSARAEAISSKKIADPQETPDREVRVVVTKAKRAAASLWMVLHAQSCRLGGESCCPHQGCVETKRLLLHVKTCAIDPVFDCPHKYHGCYQAKKLLAHYRRCREMRLRQAGPNLGKKGVRYQQHPCLVCSLVARHARNVLEGGQAPVPSISYCSEDTPLRGNMTSAPTSPSNNTTPIQRVGNSSSLKYERLRDSTKLDTQTEECKKMKQKKMPPPPPRLPLRKRSGSFREAFETSFSLSAETEQQMIYGTPPTNSQLMQKDVEKLAKVTSPPPLNRGAACSSMLGKSVDSSFMNSNNICMSANEMETECEEESCSPSSSDEIKRSFRRRAESFDERNMSSNYRRQKKRFQNYPGSCTRENFSENDPTIEMIIREGDEDSLANCEDYNTSSAASALLGMRGRSSSCGVLSSLVHSGGCDTILEE